MRAPRLPLLFVLLAALVAGPPLAAHAQQQQQQQQRGTDERTALPGNLPEFTPLHLADPNVYRAGSGQPGPEYWQNEANYEIDVTLRPEAERLEGTVTIDYVNNAPQALSYLWLQLDQNLFKADSRGAALTSAEDRFSGAFGEGGYEITNLRVGRGDAASEADYLIDDTRMRIALDEPLAADGGELSLSMDFAFKIPEYGADRMGQFNAEAGTVFELAQWYPRMFVFDDVSGWNTLPYLGQGEYYLDYGTFDVNVTVPRGMIVAATGTLENAEDVLTSRQRRRLRAARSSRTPVTIIGPGEAGSADVRPSGSGPLTWQFRAENVRDFSWAASASFIWDAAMAETGAESGPTLAQSYYPAEGVGSGDARGQEAGWEHSTEYVQHAIEHYSEMWNAPYPYPTATNVAGIVGGMEYPMITFCSVEARGPSLFGVTDHEFGHEWFPMIVGSDERRHAWMDEGLNTFINQYSTLAYYRRQPASVRQSLRAIVRESALDRAADRPIATYSDRVPYQQLGFLAYRKPAAGLFLLREYVLGQERFDAAFEAYFDRWAYKHPQPADLFRTIENVSGEDLDWFWRGWFFSNDRLDQAITNVSVRPGEGGDTTRVELAQEGDLLMPIDVRVRFADGSTTTRRIPVEAFFNEDGFTAVFPGRAERVRLDPRGFLPDVDYGDNAWAADRGIVDPSSLQ